METNGIVPLTKFEIEMVSGGKSVVERYWDSLARWIDGLSGPPGSFSFPLTGPEIVDITRFISDNGGSVSQSGSLLEGTLNIRLTGGDGSFTWVNVTGVRP